MIFIADLIDCPTCFGHNYAHHQEFQSIIQVVAACLIWCFGFQVVGMVWSWVLCVRFAGCCCCCCSSSSSSSGENFYSLFTPSCPPQGLNITGDFLNSVLFPFFKVSSATYCECNKRYTHPALISDNSVCWHIQGDSRLVDITAGGDFLGLCDQKSSYKHVSDFGRLRSYDRLKLRREGNDYWQ